MHPEVQSDKAGKCPKCGMNLERTTTRPAAAMPLQWDRGHNDSYRTFTNFAGPVARPTPDIHAPALFPIANREENVALKNIAAATARQNFPATRSESRTVRYDLYVNDTAVNFTGKKRMAIAVNGSIPAPTLVFTVGDTALIYVHNQGAEPTAVHWHGVFLPNRMDGVPYLTQMPIPPKTTYIYKFPVVQDGTYWYHSHFSLQEQVGLYGALIFNKRSEPDIPTLPLVLSDWTDMHPMEVDRSLHTANDWFAIKKKATQSYSEAISAGRLGTKLANEWKRMAAMDVSDVFYERFLVNGKPAIDYRQFRAGDRVRLRVVNGSASTYFWLTWAGGKITVVANDGNDVEPVEVDRLIVSVSETYDVLVTLPDDKQYEFLVTPEDRTKYASAWLGNGQKVPAAKLPRLEYFEGMKMMNSMMKLNGDMKPMGMQMSLQKMDMNAVMYTELKNRETESHPAEAETHNGHVQTANDGLRYTCPMHPEVKDNKPGDCPKCGMKLVAAAGKTAAHGAGTGPVTLNYDMLRSPEATTLPAGPWRTLKFELTGNMNRYVWTLDNKTVSESDKILIRSGENLRIVLYNNSMMRHPMHLHGHDFRVVNKHGEHAPLKNVLDIMPMETDTLEFHASESGDWFFHCHILYHMMSGMGRIFSSQDSIANPELPDKDHALKMLYMDDRMFHFTAQNDFASNGNDGELQYSNTRWSVQGEWRIGYNGKSGYEIESHFGRYIGKMQWLLPYIGFDWRYRNHMAEERSWFGQRSTKNDRKVFHAGFRYTLPWLVTFDAAVNHTGYVRLQLMREDIPLSPRLRASFMINTDREYMAGGKYILNKYLGLSAHFDSDMGWGGGLTLSY
ncbi:copper oxidase [Pedobacter yulinensis]|uniref:Copper oxidase n=2 Tax=Pedobacter yulinensis TaxID=2126353 RepID=A0A2T3HMT4_9SPHI|nr:copper oxidase [Pedobacter yulinensis]